MQTEEPQEFKVPSLQEITQIYDPLIANMEAYFNEMYKTRNSMGKIDLDVMRAYAAYNIGENFIRINSLLLQAQHHMADLQGKLSELKVRAIDDVKRGKHNRGYDVSASESKDLVDGHPKIVECQRALNKQISIVNYLKAQLELAKFFPNNVKILMELFKTRMEYGASV